MQNEKPRRMRTRKVPISLYVISFLFGLQFALPLYINSTFLARDVSERNIGILYAASALAGMFLFVAMPRILHRYGNYRSITATGALQALLLIIIPWLKNPLVIVMFFLYLSSVHLIPYYLDIFLENISKDATTGGTRGAYLTAMSLGILLAPLIIGVVLVDHDFWKIYFLSAALLLGTLLFVRTHLREFQDPRYHSMPLLLSLQKARRNRAMYAVCMIQILLYVFYSWMIIYVPLYLTKNIGFDWSTIGFIFTAMLVPFVLVEWPLGWIADRWLGEKEFLSAGFVIMALSTGVLSFLTKTTPLVWASALVATRIGASMVEIMSETYFFKHVTSADASLIAIFRMTKPAAFVVGPLLAVMAFSFFEFRYLFLILGIFMLLGLRYSIPLKDTR